jgi:hypothetical protein
LRAAEARGQRRGDLAGGGEAPFLVLVEEQLAVEPHREHAFATLDELRLEAEALGDLGRQTGGPGLVVSDDAVFDGQPGHGAPPCARL